MRSYAPPQQNLTDLDLGPWLPHGAALKAYFGGEHDAVIIVYDDHGDVDELPASYFFREPAEFPEIETNALSLCRGRILDVGSGAGCHSLFLQDRGFDVCSIEVLPELVEILSARGLKNVRQAEIFDFEEERFDTVLMLMNGIGLAGTVAGLEGFLLKAESLVADGGQILADSTDLRGKMDPTGHSAIRQDGRYVGEITFQLEFDGQKGSPFPQVYADPDLLRSVTESTGWGCEIIVRNEEGGFLVRITK